MIGRSGNPGYLDGLPVLVGVPTGSSSASTAGNDGTTTDPFAITDADKVDAYPSGFKVRGADAEGKCIDSSGATSARIEDFDYFDPVLEFNQDLVYSCEAAKTTLSSTTCQNMDFSNHLIFTHLEAELLAFGSFGSANPHKIEVSVTPTCLTNCIGLEACCDS